MFRWVNVEKARLQRYIQGTPRSLVSKALIALGQWVLTEAKPQFPCSSRWYSFPHPILFLMLEPPQAESSQVTLETKGRGRTAVKKHATAHHSPRALSASLPPVWKPRCLELSECLQKSEKKKIKYFHTFKQCHPGWETSQNGEWGFLFPLSCYGLRFYCFVNESPWKVLHFPGYVLSWLKWWITGTHKVPRVLDFIFPQYLNICVYNLFC